eukprot:NODE_3728_length_527_cov_919.669456_g3168_i0.p1 GENE.NODE_3728_length_527_cov_919.669456_g3168_i0~~NODE_3728_length_527_cov_919.669456_g3168_i0.p1  ORF type:complete len:121 (+),score=35.90 NODE_3728_length_527_cov_919.669456_g3168_i0:77-439(+)
MPPKAAGKKAGGKTAGKNDKGGKSGAGKKEGAKAKKKKWSKGKVREKLNNMVMWDKATKDKLYADVPKYKVITTSVISDRLKVNGSMAREALRALVEEGLITAVNVTNTCKVYTRAIHAE